MSARGSTLGGEVKSGIVTFLTLSYILLVNPQILGVAGGWGATFAPVGAACLCSAAAAAAVDAAWLRSPLARAGPCSGGAAQPCRTPPHHVPPSPAGLPVKAVVAATALSSMIASLVTGLMSNLPVGVSPGMGLNAYLVYSQVGVLDSPFCPGWLFYCWERATAANCWGRTLWLSLAGRTTGRGGWMVAPCGAVGGVRVRPQVTRHLLLATFGRTGPGGLAWDSNLA